MPDWLLVLALALYAVLALLVLGLAVGIAFVAAAGGWFEDEIERVKNGR